MREKGTVSRAQERAENAEPELQGKDPDNKNAVEKLSGQAFTLLLSNWISEQFHVVFVPDGLKRSPGAQLQDGQD